MMAGASGTFVGHISPGLAFAFWGFWWLGELVRWGPPDVGHEPIERTLMPPALKIFALVIATPLEMPNAGWLPADWVMGWHHITGYIGLGLSAVVDLLARRGVLGPRATYLALAGAMFNGAILFYGHGNPPGVEGAAHAILTLLFFAVGIFAVLEIAAPSWGIAWFRTGSMIVLGSWLTLSGWILFRSGWDLGDHVRVGHVWLRFSWLAMGVAVLVTIAGVWSRRREPLVGHRPGQPESLTPTADS
jgi:hypothetical protein